MRFSKPVPYLMALAALLCGAADAVAGLLNPGDIVVGDIDLGALFRADPATGTRSILSGPAAGSGTAFISPRGISIEANGTVLAVDNGVDAILSVDPNSGNRTVFSGSGVGGGQAFVLPFGITIAASGQIFVADAGDMAGDGFIVRVDPSTGQRIVISGLGAGSGVAFGEIRGIASAQDGSLIVADIGNSALYRVDPITGARTIISDETHGNGLAIGTPMGLALDGHGNVLVADAGDGAVLSVNPLTGNRTLISGAGAGTGSAFSLPFGIALNASGGILVGDSGDLSIPTLPAIFQVDPASGNRSILSDFAHGAGTRFSNFDIGLAVVPSPVPEPGTFLLLVSGGVGLYYTRCRVRHSAAHDD
jgi:DNA-binding beta-propeller fold protein YncE